MILLPECLNALKYSVFWQNNDNPSLKKFLDFRFNSGNLENQTIEHSRYRSELDTISTYYTETSEVGRIVRKCKKDFADDKNSRTIKLFWNKQDIAMESEIIDEEAQLQWKKGTLEFERTGLNYLQATSSAVQEKQISSYTSYKQSTSKFATSTKKKSTRKRKSVCYTESSGEEDHSSDQDYTEELKRKQNPGSKRSRRKANCDGTDKGVVVPSVETSDAPNLEYTTSHEITPSTSLTSLETSEDVATSSETSEGITTSREGTPCPVIQSIQQTSLNTISISHDTPRSVIQSTQQASIFTPQKPIITKTMYDRYSPYLICAFNATINYIEESVEEGVYIEIKNLLQAKDRLILQETIVNKLDALFETEYTKIESKIISETEINGDNQTEEARFNFFIRDTLLDFVANFRYRMPRVLDREISERTYIVESLSPIFRAFRNAFPDIKYDWIEKNVASIKEANNMFADDISPRKTDLLVIRLSDGLEIMNTEVSGPPFKVTREHTVGDAKKLLMMSLCSLCRMLGNNLDCGIEIAKEIKSYSIQIIGDRLTLFSVSLIGKEKFLAVELVSCLIPFSFDAIHYYTKIFNFFMTIRTEFVNQEKLRRKMYSSALVDNSEKVRDWLLLPDDYFFYDLKPLPEDIDEVIVI